MGLENTWLTMVLFMYQCRKLALEVSRAAWNILPWFGTLCSMPNGKAWFFCSSWVWLDLANAYGSVPHALIKFSMEFFHLPGKFMKYVMQYYYSFKMWFTTGQYTTKWPLQPAQCSNLEHVHRNTWKIFTRKAASFEQLEVGIPICMGCTISLILFVMAMETVIRGAKNYGRGVELSPGKHIHTGKLAPYKIRNFALAE